MRGGETINKTQELYSIVKQGLELTGDPIDRTLTVRQIVENMIGTKTSYKWFWDWMKEQDLDLLDSLNDIELDEGEVSYHIFMMSEDIVSGILESFGHSLGALLKDLST